MSDNGIRSFFDERRDEVIQYLALMKEIDQSRRQGAALSVEGQIAITPLQQHILYANVFVQLYNLVEATITRCLEALQTAADGYRPDELTTPVLREWVRFKARTHSDRAYDKRLDAAVSLTDHLIGGLSVGDFKIEAGGGGNWDDREIEKVARRIGCDLDVERAVRESAKRRIRDDLGALQMVKELRNRLAHGLMSFGECGADYAVSDVESIADAVLGYLDAVVTSFVDYLDELRFAESRQAVRAE